jgi:hypothetical protein
VSDGPQVWVVIDSDNFECGGIVSLHWSKEGAAQYAREIVSHEDVICLQETGSRMKLIGPMEWNWTHRTVKIEQAVVRP